MSRYYRPRVFLLGAGFSAGAGVLLTERLLQRASSLMRDEAQVHYWHFGKIAAHVGIDLEGKTTALELARLCTYLDFIELSELPDFANIGGRRHLWILKYFLSKAIAMSTPRGEEIPEVYLDFARALEPADIVVTFNWDTLLEQSLEHVGGKYRYDMHAEEEAPLLLKLHGSVNWSERHAGTFRNLGLRSSADGSDVLWSEELLNRDGWNEQHRRFSDFEPLIVLPGYGKSHDVRKLSAFWQQPDQLYQQRMTIIGFSAAHDDFIVDALLRNIFRGDRDLFYGGAVRVINPDVSVERTFQEIIHPPRKVSFSKQRFSSGSLGFALHEMD